MTRACHLPIRAATGDAFSDAEIDDILERLANRHKRVKGAAAGASDKAAWAQAMAEETHESLRDALIARRLEAAAQAASEGRWKIYDQLTAGGLDEADALRAQNVGTEKQAVGGADSVDAEGRALAASLVGRAQLGLEAIDGDVIGRLSNFFGAGDMAFERKVAREMARANGGAIEATGDEAAAQAGKVLAAASEEARGMQNRAGAWIGKIDGYIGRQSHDGLKVAGGFWRELRVMIANKTADLGEARLLAARKAFREWRDFITPRLDPRTFDGVDARDLGDAANLARAGVIDDAADVRERFLFHVWSDIVSGAHETLSGASDLGEFRPPAGKARAVSKSRVLHFASPDAWLDYHGRFGKGSFIGAVLGDLERAGQNTALMRRWGPNPQAAFDNDLTKLVERARQRGDAQAMKRLGAGMRRAEFAEITGEANRPDSVRGAIIGRMIRLDQSLSKLGGMVLSAVGSDQALAAATMKRAGATWLSGYQGAFGGILRLGSEDAKRAADLVDVGARGFASHLTGRFTAGDGPLGWGASMQRLFYKVNGFEFVAEGHRKGVAAMLSAHLGEQAQFAWNGLAAGTRETLERFGVDQAGWDLVRRGAAKAEDGRTYLTFERLGEISDAEAWSYGGLSEKKTRTAASAQRVRDGLETRFRAMVTNILDDSLTEPRARERVGLTRGAKPGTILGEAIRTATQFWSFNQAVLGRHVAPALRGYAGQKPVALMGHLILMTTLGGFASMQAKQLAKGRELRPLVDEDGKPDGGIWLAALLQGGGLGIYGDFLFGEANRNGLGFSVGSLAGPAVSELEAVATIVRKAISGDVEDLGADTVKLAVRNTPLVNLWYSRWALDYLVLWRLQEAMSPGYLSRYERRVQKDEGAGFLISPSEAVN